ncbi:MAG: hypothetical protein LBM96_11295 [Methanobrevibacter sp.]|jgi:hypothetical protein|nr:hypothetical protein [Candidatus Methanoflexus mossambicus]
MKINKYLLVGIVLIAMAICLLFNNTLDAVIRPFTYIILMGSSKGKDILFFGIFGLYFIITGLFIKNKKTNKTSKKNNSVNPNIINNTNNKTDNITNMNNKTDNITNMNNKTDNITNIDNKTDNITNIDNNTNNIANKSNMDNTNNNTINIVNKNNDNSNNNFYLKIAIVLILLSSAFGVILEIILRLNLGINIFTILSVLANDYTTTSILHSHVFKSILGGAISYFKIGLSGNIHTGGSLLSYVPKIAYLIVIIIPALFILSLKSLKDRLTPSKIILMFSYTLAIIGLIDGGIFAIPTLIAIYGVLLIYFAGKYIDTIIYYIKNKISHIIHIKSDNKRNFTNKLNMINRINRINRINEINEINNKNNKIKFNKNDKIKILIPHIILFFIIFLRITIAIYGTNVEYYEVNILDNQTNENNLDKLLNNYDIENLRIEENKTIVKIAPKYNEMELLNNLTKNLKGKADIFSLTWNFYSYF